MTSPLGKYAPLVASAAALLLIGAYVFALLLLPNDPSLPLLQDAALIAIGAVFGSAVGVNGWKGEVAAIHSRLDKAGIPSAADTTTTTPSLT